MGMLSGYLGQPLPLSIATAFVLTVGTFAFSSIFDAGDVHFSAADSGSIKEAEVTAATTQDEFESLINAASGNTEADIASYNRMIASAMVGAFSAASDEVNSGDPNSSNAKSTVEGSSADGASSGSNVLHYGDPY